MENLCKGLLIGMAAGFVVGAVAVVKNRCLHDKVKQGVSMAQDKLEEAADKIAKKIESNENSNKNDFDCSKSDGCNNRDYEESDSFKKTKK